MGVGGWVGARCCMMGGPAAEAGDFIRQVGAPMCRELCCVVGPCVVLCAAPAKAGWMLVQGGAALCSKS